MAWHWIHESPALWDATKQEIVGRAPEGIFSGFARYRAGDVVPGEWWRVEDDGRILGYGWMDHSWGDAEILLAVAPAEAGRGVGSFILDGLDRSAAAEGLNYLYNTVRPSHPDRDAVTSWLERRGFRPRGEGQLERRVGTSRQS